MVTFIFALLSLALAVIGVLLRQAYDIVPAHELRRQAAASNQLAKTLYRAVGYGQSLRVLLWLFVLIGSTIGFVLMASLVSPWQGVLINGTLAGIIFALLPKTHMHGSATALAKTLTPAIAWILHYLDASLRLLARLLGRGQRSGHSGIYELQDMLDLLDLQGEQNDSRITHEEITLMRNVLKFGDQKVYDHMRPAKNIKSVALGDAIGPILLDELHLSGQTVFPVRKSARSKEIVGSLQIGDVGIHSQGTVKDYATQGIGYVNEADSLADALHRFFQTKQQLFIVVDNEQEFLGIITLEDILHALVGSPASDEATTARHDEQTVVE